jgi:hypothetical protein
MTGISGNDNYGQFTVRCAFTGFTRLPQITMFFDTPRPLEGFAISKLGATCSPGIESMSLDEQVTATSCTWTLNGVRGVSGPTALAFFTIKYRI